MVRPGELVVIQRGIRFKVKLPDGPVRGCKSYQEALFYKLNPYMQTYKRSSGRNLSYLNSDPLALMA